MGKIVPSILSADFTRPGEESAAVERAGADWIHVDVMDGHFVPNLTMGLMTVEAVRRVTGLPVAAHLMIENPDLFIERFVDAGATHISVHAETATHLDRVLQLVRRRGARPGIALGPAAPLSLIEWSLDEADYVDIPAVNLGFGGQSFIPRMLDKIRTLRAEITRRGLSTLIESDGGINGATIAGFADAGVDLFVVGSALFGSGDYTATMADLRRASERSAPAAGEKSPAADRTRKSAV
jgi:ribulose-phosphate 3-epimerase